MALLYLSVMNIHIAINFFFFRRVHVVCVDRAQVDDVEEVWVCKSKEEVHGVAEGSGNEEEMAIKK
jgi:hypothetical protein